MKRVRFILVVLVSSMLTSCQKDYTCVCAIISKKQDTIMDKVKTIKVGSKGFKETCVKYNQDSLKYKDCDLE
jgi:hypothetical protein